MKESEIQRHIEALKSKETDLRRDSAVALGKLGIGARESVPSLIEALKDDSLTVRRVAAWALGEIGAQEAVPYLRNALKDELIFDRAANALGKIGDPAPVPELIQGLRSNDNTIRGTAAWSLAKIGEPAIPAILEAFGEGSWGGTEILAVLGEIGDPRAIPYLILSLRDKNERVRQGSAAALRKVVVNYEATTSDPIKLMLKDPRISEVALKDFHKVLEDKDDGVRLIAAWVLGEFGNRSIIHYLIKMLKDKSQNVRKEAVQSLGKIGDPSAVSAVTKATKDKDESVREAAAKTLKKLEDNK